MPHRNLRLPFEAIALNDLEGSPLRGSMSKTSGDAPGPSAPSAEDDLIATYFRPLATHPGAFGLTWTVVDLALKNGGRGLARDSSLA